MDPMTGMGLGQILVLWLGIMAGTVFPILLVLWIVYVIGDPRRRAAERKAKRQREDPLAWDEDTMRDRSFSPTDRRTSEEWARAAREWPF